MRPWLLAGCVMVGALAGVGPGPAWGAEPGASEEEKMPGVLGYTMDSITGEPVELSKYEGKVVLIVNVASKCGYTKQYADLQALHEKYAERGLAILGFPCNQFKGQEPGTEAEILEFCRSNYGVSFDLFEKVEVSGENAAPLYRYLTSDEVPIEDKGEVKWNFEKFLVDREGKVIARYRSKVVPTGEEMVAAIEAALGPAEKEGEAATAADEPAGSGA